MLRQAQRAALFSAMLPLSVMLTVSPALAQSAPDSENGRYSFSATVDGVLRLDTRTGRIASCHNRVAGWSCYAVPDERAALDAEIGRLERENAELASELASLKDQHARFDSEIGALKQAQERILSERVQLKQEIEKLAQAASNPEPPLTKTEAQKNEPFGAAGSAGRLERQPSRDTDTAPVVSALKRTWERLVESANRIQRGVSERI